MQSISLEKIHKYWDSLKPQNNVKDAIEDVWKQKAAFMDEISLQNNVVIFLWNAFTSRFLYMSDKLKILSGIDPSLFMAENGIEFSMSRIPSEHIEGTLLLTQKVFAHYKANTAAENKNTLACMNYLYKNGNEEYEQVLQRTIVLETADNNEPLLLMSFVHYVGQIKKRDSIGAVVSMPDKIVMYNYDTELQRIDDPKIFSEQEKKIITLLAEGDDSKSISKKLSISPNTVDTHRRNLIKKTNCIDTTGVVAFAKLINLA